MGAADREAAVTRAGSATDPVAWSEVARRGIVIALWVTAFLVVMPLGEAVVPDATKAKVSYQTFLLACHALTLAVGLGAALLLLRRRRAGLGFDRLPAWAPLTSTIASVPVVFVASSYVAIQIALPTLLEELRTRGAGASQQNTGEFGRVLTQAPLFTTLVLVTVVGALGEELFFRGILWSTITDLTRRLLPASRADDVTLGAAAEAGAEPGAIAGTNASPTLDRRQSLAQRALSILLLGGIATLCSAALFGYMHRGTPGGVGIVRIVSTTCLGFASGIVRHVTGGVVACIALHALYNTLVIGGGRGWFASKETPIVDGVSNTLLLAAVVGVVTISVVVFVQALAERRARSVFVGE